MTTTKGVWYKYRIKSRGQDGQLANDYEWRCCQDSYEAAKYKQDLREAIHEGSDGFVTVEEIIMEEAPNYPHDLY